MEGSLVKRLAGPSTGKAGLAKDQTEINAIIAEASKGSQFYENEKKKDQDLTERIARVLKQRNEAIHGVDIASIEASVDRLLAELEAQRDLNQIIVHVDMDAFFANVELLFNPGLKDKPFGVGHGVLSTASYEARKFGVRSGMPTFIAKKLCPSLIITGLNFARYNEKSTQVMSIFKRYDSQMCPASCDEGYLNITAYCKEHDISAEVCVSQMRQTVFEETQLTVSAGIAPNKVICSDKNKPNGQFYLPFDSASIRAFMKDLSIRKIPGVGRVNERLLDSIGIKTCGDIYTHRAVISLMDKQFGLNFLMSTYLGIASNVVQPHVREERKSIGAERTFHAISDKDQVLQKLQEIAEELENDMIKTGWTGKTVTLKFKLDTFQVFTRAKSLDRWIRTKEELFSIGKELITPEFPLRLRLIGLRVTKLKDLRAPSPKGGIKRFFDSAANSPNKKRKTDSVTEDLSRPSPEAPDVVEEFMPGFHEFDEADETGPMPWDQGDVTEGEVGTTAVSAHITDPPRSPSPDGVKPQTCPVCNRTLQLNNVGLNQHIDWCLSKGAILDAQIEASTSREGTALSNINKTKNNARPRSTRKS
ncbi:DNA/RNA polymerase [Fistulina hepatica ATCC 64428]|uniref:DNA polymerase kappa n=1 Tax=Fistulina hepatica ATCC 64428 TaxID=1128425 RepID=A0A0D7A054_9AGAR|nr:DNA/RNA polymerase [Fistulina hepatica ATCC 64428]